MAASIEFLSSLGKPVPPPTCPCGLAFTFTFSRSASTFTKATCASLVLMAESAAGTPMTDLGRKSPVSDLVDFFMLFPILRIIMEADEAVDDMERLSVDPVKKLP